MSTKEPTATERAIAAQKRGRELAELFSFRRDMLTGAELSALFAVQSLYDQLEAQYGASVARVARLENELRRLQSAVSEPDCSLIEELLKK